MTGGGEADKFKNLLAQLDEIDRPNDYGFELVRSWPGLAFVKELYEPHNVLRMAEISDIYDRRIIPRHLYIGKTDWEAGTEEKKLWPYAHAQQFNENDLEALRKGVPIFVRNEDWASSFTGESGIWTGLKIFTHGERKLMWGFEFNADWS